MMKKWLMWIMSKLPGRQAMITCQQVIDLLSDYLNDEIDAEVRRTLEKHFEGCQNCEAFFKSLRQSVHLLRELKYEEIPEEVSSRLKNVLRARINPAK